MKTSESHPPSGAAPATRERLIAAMQGALQRKGYHGVGLSELLANANAPKGVLYHHFPGGKSELAVATIGAVVEQLGAGLDKLFGKSTDLVQALGAWMGSAQKALAASGFEQGCPLATIALESTPDDTAIRQALDHGFDTIRQRLALALARAGVEETRARNLSALIVSAYEGSLVQSRVAGNVDAMRNTSEALMDMVRLSLPQATLSNPTPPNT